MPEIPLVSAKEVVKKEKKPETKPKPQETKPPVTPIRKRVAAIPLIEEEVLPTKLKREPSGARPVIPKEDSCCIGLCTYLNSEIDTISQGIDIRQGELEFLARGVARMRTKRAVSVLKTKISTLKDLRFALADKNICKCIELPKS